MIRANGLYKAKGKHTWHCSLCPARGAAWSALWALWGFENHYIDRHMDKP